MSFFYLITLFFILGIFVAFILLKRHFKNVVLTNIILVSITVTCYLTGVLISYLKNGPNDWNFLNTLPVANVSPFMFFICPLFFALPKFLRKYFGATIALLVVGMILSPVISCVYFFSISYKFHLSFLPDYFAHISLAAFGVYLVCTNQVELTLKNVLIGGGILVSVALTMLILNLIFDTSFFGLSLRGKHNIYNFVIVDNSYLSALLYFVGLGVALLAGFGFQKLLLKIIKSSQK